MDIKRKKDEFTRLYLKIDNYKYYQRKNISRLFFKTLKRSAKYATSVKLWATCLYLILFIVSTEVNSEIHQRTLEQIMITSSKNLHDDHFMLQIASPFSHTSKSLNCFTLNSSGKENKCTLLVF